MKLKDLLKQQVNKVEKRTITLPNAEGKTDECDIYVKVMSCGEVESFAEGNIGRQQVALTILDEKHKPIFTVDELREIPYDIYIQLVSASNEVNGVGKIAP